MVCCRYYNWVRRYKITRAYRCHNLLNHSFSFVSLSHCTTLWWTRCCDAYWSGNNDDFILFIWSVVFVVKTVWNFAVSKFNNEPFTIQTCVCVCVCVCVLQNSFSWQRPSWFRVQLLESQYWTLFKHNSFFSYIFADLLQMFFSFCVNC